MRKKQKEFRITEDDYIKAVKKADREEEIRLHGKQASNRTVPHRNRRAYDRNRLKPPGEED